MLVEIRRVGRTLKQRTIDVLAFFDRPGTSNGLTEAINGRLEHLCGSALGLHNLTHYIARSLLESGGFSPHPHPGMRCARIWPARRRPTEGIDSRCWGRVALTRFIDRVVVPVRVGCTAGGARIAHRY